MFGFIVLLSFGGCLVTKCMSLNNEQCIARSTLADLNLDSCTESSNSVNDLL